MQYLNVRDMALIFISAFVVIWGGNHILRAASAPDLQA